MSDAVSTHRVFVILIRVTKDCSKYSAECFRPIWTVCQRLWRPSPDGVRTIEELIAAESELYHRWSSREKLSRREVASTDELLDVQVCTACCLWECNCNIARSGRGHKSHWLINSVMYRVWGGWWPSGQKTLWLRNDGTDWKQRVVTCDIFTLISTEDSRPLTVITVFLYFRLFIIPVIPHLR